MSRNRAWPASFSPLRAALLHALVLAASFACILPGLLLSCVILAVYVVTARGWGLLLALAGEALARPALLTSALIGAALLLVALLVWLPRLLHGLMFAVGLVSTAIDFVASPSTGGDAANWLMIGLGLLGSFIAALAVRRTSYAATAAPGAPETSGDWPSSAP